MTCKTLLSCHKVVKCQDLSSTWSGSFIETANKTCIVEKCCLQCCQHSGAAVWTPQKSFEVIERYMKLWMACQIAIINCIWNILSLNCKEPNSLERIKSWHDLLYLYKTDKHQRRGHVVFLLHAFIRRCSEQSATAEMSETAEEMSRVRFSANISVLRHCILFKTNHISYFPLTPPSIPLPASPFLTHALLLSFPQPPTSYPSNPDTPCAASPQIPLQS